MSGNFKGNHSPKDVILHTVFSTSDALHRAPWGAGSRLKY